MANRMMPIAAPRVRRALSPSSTPGTTDGSAGLLPGRFDRNRKLVPHRFAGGHHVVPGADIARRRGCGQRENLHLIFFTCPVGRKVAILCRPFAILPRQFVPRDPAQPRSEHFYAAIHRRFRNTELMRDFLARAAVGEQVEHRALPRRSKCEIVDDRCHRCATLPGALLITTAASIQQKARLSARFAVERGDLTQSIALASRPPTRRRSELGSASQA